MGLKYSQLKHGQLFFKPRNEYSNANKETTIKAFLIKYSRDDFICEK